ncbi:hypothetical protein, partial [Citrobacter gillenii]|uniref:hypothetical protein n=1 Tax=Citrobacter gillenii TaxID=67828 RepID=UPI0022E60E53
NNALSVGYFPFSKRTPGRSITEGKQTELRGKATKGGYTVWKMKSGHPTPIYVADLDKAVRECLK